MSISFKSFCLFSRFGSLQRARQLQVSRGQSAHSSSRTPQAASVSKVEQKAEQPMNLRKLFPQHHYYTVVVKYERGLLWCTTLFWPSFPLKTLHDMHENRSWISFGKSAMLMNRSVMLIDNKCFTQHLLIRQPFQ